jgi:hypothetical protein
MKKRESRRASQPAVDGLRKCRKFHYNFFIEKSILHHHKYYRHYLYLIELTLLSLLFQSYGPGRGCLDDEAVFISLE